ncbi:MAG: DegQ family serine endoprotease [Verrucomicrobiota bacterium]|nr:DegQ family serine endoprotease [Verrucomicrobiota bacterium]
MKALFNSQSSRRLVFGLGAAVLVGGSLLAIDHPTAAKPKDSARQKVEVDETPLPRQAGSRMSFAPIVKKVAPGVVKLTVTAKAASIQAPQGFGFDDQFWRRFFGEQFGNRNPNRQFTPPRQQGLGSGVIVTKDGYILTNNHVVEGADEVKVSLHDGRELIAKVIGRDPKSDVAVIKIEGKDLPFVPMADSEQVEVGDVVLAIGNPFGVGQTVTTGIVSATGRGNLGIEDYEDFIQTDAAINPGNSGGALVDVEGRLIGINTAIYSRTGGNQGIGFAIPSDLAHDVMTSLIKDGKVTRGYLGVMIQDVTPALAKEFKLKDAAGALIGDVVPKGPADKAGLKQADVVLEFNGKKVPDSRRLRLMVGTVKPGTAVPVKILREGSTKSLEVTVQQQPGTEEIAKGDGPVNPDNGTLNGVSVSDLDPEARQQMKIPEHITGAVITEVEPGSPAAEAGLKAGDVIQEINRHPVKTAEEAVKLTETPKDKVTLLRVWSNGGSRYVVVDESKAR